MPGIELVCIELKRATLGWMECCSNHGIDLQQVGNALFNFILFIYLFLRCAHSILISMDRYKNNLLMDYEKHPLGPLIPGAHPWPCCKHLAIPLGQGSCLTNMKY
jgi:hypothetical protein